MINENLFCHDILDEYFMWLTPDILHNRRCTFIGYQWLIKILFNTPFVATIELDNNRCGDVSIYRHEFLAHMGLEDHNDIFNETLPCTVLEILIVLASRMVDNSLSEDIDVGDCFWEFIENLGLIPYMDGYRPYEIFVLEVNDILNRFMQREYKSNGEGGIFPLRNAGRDQREVELWYQMMAYIAEKEDSSYINDCW